MVALLIFIGSLLWAVMRPPGSAAPGDRCCEDLAASGAVEFALGERVRVGKLFWMEFGFGYFLWSHVCRPPMTADMARPPLAVSRQRAGPLTSFLHCLPPRPVPVG